MSSLTVEDLILYFENRLNHVSSNQLNALGREPRYPMLVVFLGDEAINAFYSIASNLYELWPQYQRELQFIGIRKKGSSVSYVKLEAKDGEVLESHLESNDVSDVVSSLFGLQNHFQDRSKLFAYFVLDTTEVNEYQDFMTWIDIMNKTRTVFGVESSSLLSMLIVLLNESFSRRGIANSIRNRIGEYYDEDNRLAGCNSIFVLSNKRSDYVILEDWRICYRIVSSVIALSNNEDTHVASALFSKKVMTASYACEQKPLEKIGQVIVTKLIDSLNNLVVTSKINPFEDDSILERLGVTSDGTVAILDGYARKVLVPLLPSLEQLSLFPRSSMESYDIGELTSSKFNDLTMNAWDSYLSQVVCLAQKKINVDSKIRYEWKNQYTEQIKSNFSFNELIYLAENIESVKMLLLDKRKPSSNLSVMSAAEAKLKYLLSSDSVLIDIFISVIEELGNSARDFQRSWQSLCQSKQSVFSIRDDNISTFYEKKVVNYFDFHSHELADKFMKMQCTDELRQFLEECIDEIIASDSIFTEPFEDELEHRLSGDASSHDAKQYIRQKLTGEDVCTYLQANFSFSQPMISAILIKVGTSLYKNLYNNLNPSTYYYNTGCGNLAEAVNVYEVNKLNLINSESDVI